MKGIIKLIPAALALVALASCSNNDLFGEMTTTTQEKVKGGLTVSVEGFDNQAGTRQANLAANKNKVVWQNGDLINVYDEDLTKYDVYKFKDDKFVGINENPDGDTDASKTRISSTKFALFPADRVEYAGWRDKVTKAVMTIPQLVIYDEEREIQTDNGTAYVSNLPMWGNAKGTYPEAEVDLKLLTAAFKINIKDAFANNITFLKVEAQDDEPIVGAFEANLSEDEPKLAKGANSLITDNTMYVDLRNVPSYMTYIYLPILARHYDYLKVMVTSVKGTEASALEDNADLIVSDLEAVTRTEDATTGWKTIRNWEAGVTFNRADIQPLSKETQYNLDNITTCEMVTKALKQYANYEGELVLNIAKNDPFAITREGDVDDYTIYVPEMKAEKVTINVQDASGIDAGYANARMEIVDADIKKPYTGTIELNAKDVQTNDLDLTINLPKTSFSLMGFDGGTNNLDEIDVKNVQTLTIGGQIGDPLAPVTTALAATTTLNISTAKEVIVKNQATVESGIDVVATKNIEKVLVEEGGLVKTKPLSALYVKNGIHVQGQLNTAYVYDSRSKIWIGEDIANGKMSYVYTIGDIEIANKEESVAIINELNVLGNNNITLKQGYVKKIGLTRSGEFTTAPGPYFVKSINDLTASDYTNKHVKVTFANGEGLTAIASIEDALLKFTKAGATYNFLQFTNESTWSGKTINAATFADYVAPAALAKIYTASELASISNVATDIALYNDINLGTNKAWTLPTLKQSFTGLDPRYATVDVHKARLDAVTAAGFTSTDGAKGVHTIKNLYLDNSENGVQYNMGLFAKLDATTDQTIGDVIIDGAKTNLVLVGTPATKVPGNIGVLIGNATTAQNLAISNVWVKNVTNFGNATAKTGAGKAVNGIRGISTLIGAAGKTSAGDFSIQNNKIESSTITGQAYLGGLIGWYRGAGDVTIAGNVIGTAFSVPEALQPGNYDYGVDVFGTVGIAIGQIDNTTTTVNITTNEGDTNNVNNKRDALGFKYNFKFVEDIKYGFHGNNDYVGYSKFTNDQLIINTQAYKNDDVYGVDKDATKLLPSNFNTYIQWSNWAE